MICLHPVFHGIYFSLLPCLYLSVILDSCIKNLLYMHMNSDKIFLVGFILLLSVIYFNGIYSQTTKIQKIDPVSEICGDLPSQTAMNQCAENEYLKSEKNLIKTFQEIIKDEEDFFEDKSRDRERIKQLKQSQKDWTEYKNNYCEFVSDRFAGGSIRPFVYWYCMNDLTRNRIKELKKYPEFFI